MQVAEERQDYDKTQTKRLGPCLLCYLRYIRHGVGYSQDCELYADLASLGIRGVGEQGEDVCGKLEILLRDVQKTRAGDTSATYPEHAQRMVLDVL